MKDFIDNNCSGGSPIGSDAKVWLNRPNPKPEEWKGQPTASMNQSVFDREYWEKLTGLTGAALVLYLLLSEGSRVIPARNLVPVP